MKICQQCGKELTTREQLKFCDSRCSAKYNNKNRVNKKIQKNIELIQSLIDKGESILEITKQVNISRATFKRAYPTYKGGIPGGYNGGDNTLRHKIYFSKIFSMLETDGFITNDSNPQNHKKWLKRFLISKSGAKCSQCGWGEKHPTTGNVMVEIDHIDGDPHNNTTSNVRLLCPNCHSLTPTFRNVGRKGKSI